MTWYTERSDHYEAPGSLSETLCLYCRMCTHAFYLSCPHMDVHSEHVRQLWWVVGAKRDSLPGQLGHPGSHGGPTQCPGSSVAFTGPCAAGFTRARQTDPLHAIKPSTREQRGQVLGPALRAHLHPAGEQTASRQALQEALHSQTPSHQAPEWVYRQRQTVSLHGQKHVIPW